MDRDIWNDERIALKGVMKLQEAQLQLLLRIFMPVSSREAQQANRSAMEHLTSFVLDKLPQMIYRHPLHAVIQINAANLIKGILDDPDFSGLSEGDEAVHEISTLLVNVLRNHPEEAEVHHAALSALTALKNNNPAIITAFVSGGGIPLLFTSLNKFGGGAGNDEDHDGRIIRSSLGVLRWMFEFGQSPCHQRLVQYAREHPQWHTTFQNILHHHGSADYFSIRCDASFIIGYASLLFNEP